MIFEMLFKNLLIQSCKFVLKSNCEELKPIIFINALIHMISYHMTNMKNP